MRRALWGRRPGPGRLRGRGRGRRRRWGRGGPGRQAPVGPGAEAPVGPGARQPELIFVAVAFAAATIFFGIFPSPLFHFAAHAGHAIAGLF